MAQKLSSPSVRAGLVRLARAKLVLRDASDRASREVRSCSTCDARCCRVGFNSMRVTRLEAVALFRRLSRPDLASRLPEILEKARREVRIRRLREEDTARYDCPFLDADGLCMVHGEAQPAGCLTFRPVGDGGCDHDRAGWTKAEPRLDAAERRAFGRLTEPLPIPVALLRVAGRE